MRKAGQNALRLGQDFGIVGEMTNSDAVTALAALAQDSRLAIFRLLVQNAPAGLTVGVIHPCVGTQVKTSGLGFDRLRLRDDLNVGRRGCLTI